MADDPARYVDDGSATVVSQCLSCRRLAAGPAWKCQAFPGGIPDEVVANVADHRSPIEGDGGLRFVATAGTPRAYLARLSARLDSARK